MPVVRAKGNEKRRRESARKDGRTMSPRLSERYCEGIVAFLDTLFVGYIQTASTDYSILSFVSYSLDSFHSFFPSSSVRNDKNREKERGTENSSLRRERQGGPMEPACPRSRSAVISLRSNCTRKKKKKKNGFLLSEEGIERFASTKRDRACALNIDDQSIL